MATDTFYNEKNGGFNAYPDNLKKKIFFRASDRYTKPVTVKAGQVLKAFSFLQTDPTGKVVAHSGLTESAHVTFSALTAGQTLIIAGLTFTAGASGTTATQLAKAWAGLSDGYTGGTVTGGTFTGTLTGYSTEAVDADTVVFNATSANTNATDIVATGTGAAAATITIVQGDTAMAPIAGVLAFDVDASAGDVDATAFDDASFWADALVWAVDPSVDTITLADGSTVACTTYNTGCFGTSKASNLLKQKFVENSGFSELGFLSAGETA